MGASLKHYYSLVKDIYEIFLGNKSHCRDQVSWSILTICDSPRVDTWHNDWDLRTLTGYKMNTFIPSKVSPLMAKHSLGADTKNVYLLCFITQISLTVSMSCMYGYSFSTKNSPNIYIHCRTHPFTMRCRGVASISHPVSINWKETKTNFFTFVGSFTTQN